MKLIKDLGKRNNKKYGLYECPECLDHVEIRVDTVKHHDKKYNYPKLCKTCANSLAGSKRIKHGDAYSRLYNTWRNMKDRVLNPNNPKSEIYKDKGIATEWLDYNSFKQWALSNGYSDNLSIDRIDSALGYYPDNCQWILLEENSSKDNTRASYGKNKTIKIPESEIPNIMLLANSFTHQQIADKYNVARTTIGAIIRNQRATTIPNGSTLQANGSGSGVHA